MRRLLLLPLLFAATLGFSQGRPGPARQDPALLAELNTQIWIPFHEAYRDGDPEKYLALHRPEFIRGEGANKVVRTLEEYSDGVRRSFAHWKQRGLKVDLQFRFTERIARAAQASERGVYRLALTSPEGKTDVFHGRFHTFARKADGRWQFVVDYDSDEGGTVGEAQYLAGAAVDDFNRF